MCTAPFPFLPFLFIRGLENRRTADRSIQDLEIIYNWRGPRHSDELHGASFLSVRRKGVRRKARLLGRSGKTFIAGSVPFPGRLGRSSLPFSLPICARRRRKKGFYGEEERCIACTDWRRCFNRRRSIPSPPRGNIPSSDRKIDDREIPLYTENGKHVSWFSIF